MKTKIFFLLTIFLSSLLYCQSKIVFGVGTNIYVGTGANISADTITVNGTFSGDGTFNHGPLPVELVSFNAMVVKDKVELNWKTATELNNSGFEIERATTNADWIKIGFVVGAGNSTTFKEYSFVDKPVAYGRNAYRLKQLDYEGTFKYSNVVEVNAGQIPNDYLLSQNYPNPFNPTSTIRYDIPKTSFVKISVYDILGKEIKILVNEEKSPGHYEIIFDAQGLVSGTYFYTIRSGDFTQNRKMILMK